VDKVLDLSGVSLGLDESAIDPAALERALVAYGDGTEGCFAGPYTLDEVLAPAASQSAA
jgi:hypothetical protein